MSSITKQFLFDAEPTASTPHLEHGVKTGRMRRWESATVGANNLVTKNLDFDGK